VLKLNPIGENFAYFFYKNLIATRCRWLMTVILATWEAEIKRPQFKANPDKPDPISKIIRAK
jgi:hypothetical protein